MIGLTKLSSLLRPAPSPPNKQSLLLDALRRVEQHSPIWVLPRLVQTLNLHQHLAQARQRLCDSHRAMMHDAGHEAGPCSDGGGISVRGDTTIHNHALNIGSLLWLVVLVVALAAAGYCGWVWWNKPSRPAVVGEVEDWKLSLRVTDRP